MKISKVISETGTGFEVHVRFNVDDELTEDGLYEKYSNRAIYKIVDWIVDTFSSAFVLIEKSDNILAGGCVDNKQAWEKFKKDGMPIHAQFYKYELRGAAQDISMFLLKYGKENKDGD